jgi:RNA polymerase sigma-70 factor (ECF subfamily)
MHENVGQSFAESGEFEAHRAYLLKVAQLQLRDVSLAEDAVQDTLEAAVRNRQTFRGNASRRTWLTGILRHKLADAVRRQRKHAAPFTSLAVPEHLRGVDASFGSDGAWSKTPLHWELPEEAQFQTEFLEVLQDCLGNLPPLIARAFVLREVMEMETTEISEELSVTANHLGVLMYRARMLLRSCIEAEWFDQGRAT